MVGEFRRSGGAARATTTGPHVLRRPRRDAPYGARNVAVSRPAPEIRGGYRVGLQGSAIG